MVIRGLVLAGVLCGSFALASDGLTREETSAAQCAAAEASSPFEEDPAKSGWGAGADRFERLSAWRALTLREPGGLPRYVETLQVFQADASALEATAKACGQINPFDRLPTLPTAPKGDNIACLKPLDDATSILEIANARVRADQEMAPYCAALVEMDRTLREGQQALEEGRVACLEPEQIWASIGARRFTTHILALAISERQDCTMVPGQRTASLR